MVEGGGDPRGGEGGGAGKQRQKKSSEIKYQMKIIDKGLTSQQWTHKKKRENARL